MKRKVIALMSALFMLFSMAGCSKEGLSLAQEISKVSAWEAEEVSGTMAVSMKVPDSNIDVKLAMKGWGNTKDEQAYVELALNEIKVDGAIEKDIKIAPVKMYVDKQTVYITKTYFTDLFALAEIPVSEKMNAITTEYIALDLGQTGTMDTAKVETLGKKLLSDAKLDLPITQDGRAYSIDLDANQIVDGSVALIYSVMDNIEALNEISDTGLTKEMMEAQKGQLQPIIEEGKNQIKPMIEGSYLKATYKFEDNKYQQGFEMLVKVAVDDEEVEMKMSMNADSIKTTKKAFTLPKSATIMTMEEYMNIMLSTDASNAVKMVVINEETTLVKDDVAYLPFRTVMAELGYDVAYDKATQKTYVMIEDEKVEVSTIVQKGTAYISQEELLKLGFQTLQDGELFVIFQ